MCGRYSLATPDPGDLRARFGIGESVEIKTRYNVAPGDEVRVEIAGLGALVNEVVDEPADSGHIGEEQLAAPYVAQ